MQVQESLQQLACQLQKPLRPIWISQASSFWDDSAADHSQLDFTPLILISASSPDRERRLRGEEDLLKILPPTTFVAYLCCIHVRLLVFDHASDMRVR